MRLETEKNRGGEEVLIELINKIEAMALVHYMLYKSKNLSSIKLNEYLINLPGIILQNYSINTEDIKIITDIEDISISIVTAVPLGMVISELITNTIKHAYHKNNNSADQSKEISITAVQKEETLQIHYKDNGKGIDPSIDLKESTSMGIKTIFGLIEHQLLGEIFYDGSDGLNWYITINNRN